MAADVSSTDDSGELLRKDLGEINVLPFDSRKGGYGAAVKAVLAHQKKNNLIPAIAGSADAPSSSTSSPTSSPTLGASSHEWIWLLQDDAAPAPDALERLLEAVERATTAMVAGCKELDLDNPRKLVDVGIKANRWFDRFSMVNLDELDQGQYDDRADVFAVNAAGMLVRRDVWEQLGGFDPALPGPGDDLDFCARVRLAGHRVIVVPSAKMFIAVAREDSLGSPTAARKAAVYTRLKHAPAWQVPFIALGTGVSAVYWLFAGFLLKAPGHAVNVFGATYAGLLRPAALVRGRSQLAKTRVQPRSAHKGLLATPEESRNQLKSLRESVGPEEEAEESGARGSSILEPTGDVHHEAVAPMPTLRSAPFVGALVLTVVLAIVSILSLGRFLGAPALSGGALLPLSSSLTQIWDHANNWWLSLGSGLPGHGEPFSYVLWFLGLLGLGNAQTATLWLFLLAIPLSALTGWLAAGAFSRNRWPRLIAGFIWAGAPVLQIAMGQGRVGALMAHVLIPLVILGMIRAVGGAVSTLDFAQDVRAKVGTAKAVNGKLGRPGVSRTPSWTAAAAGGLALAALTASAPSLFLLAVLVVVVASIFLGRRAKTLWWVLIPAVALYLPYAWSARGQWRAFLTDPGVPLGTTPAPVWQQLLGFPEQITASPDLLGTGNLTGVLANSTVLPWIAAGLIGAPVVVLALVALVSPLRRAGTVRSLWLLAIAALALSYAGSQVGVAVTGSEVVSIFAGPAISVVLFALLAAAIMAFDALYRRAYDSTRSRAETGRGSRVTAVVLSFILVASPVASLGLWSANNLMGNSHGLVGASEVAPQNAGTIPATAADRGTGPEASRTIVLRLGQENQVSAALMQGNGTTLDSLSGIAASRDLSGAPGSEVIAKPDAATEVLRETVANIMAGSGIDPREGLTDLGVGFVVLANGDTVSELLAGKLSAVPGLETVGPTESGWLWRVTPIYAKSSTSDVVNRVRIDDAKGAPLLPLPSSGQSINTKIPAGPAGRVVVMAERSDAGWHAWLDGKELTAKDSSWAQGFSLPATGGHLEIRFVEPWSPLLSLAQIVLLGLTILLAIPVRARRGRTGAYRDEASLHKVGRSV